jgi:hypothetical protein
MLLQKFSRKILIYIVSINENKHKSVGGKKWTTSKDRSDTVRHKYTMITSLSEFQVWVSEAAGLRVAWRVSGIAKNHT